MSSQPITETHPYAAPSLTVDQRTPNEKRPEESVSSVDKKDAPQEILVDDEESASVKARKSRNAKLRPFLLVATALVILGWWISSMIIIRRRWCVPVCPPYQPLSHPAF